MAEAAAGMEACTSGTRDRETVDAVESADVREGDQPAGAERFDRSGWGRMEGPLSDREGRQNAQEGGSWSPAVVVATATRMRTHRAGRAAVKTGAFPIAVESHLPPFLVTVVAVSMSATATQRGVRPLKWSGPPAFCGTTKAGGPSMTTRRRVQHGSIREWMRGRGHVGVLVGALAGTLRGRRAPGTATNALRAPPPSFVGALPARHAREWRRRENPGRRCARAEDAEREGYGGGRRGAVGGLHARTRRVAEPRAEDTTGPSHCVPATVGDRWLPARGRVRPR